MEEDVRMTPGPPQCPAVRDSTGTRCVQRVHPAGEPHHCCMSCGSYERWTDSECEPAMEPT